MLQSRRGFLIGAGSLLTAAFVSDARSFHLQDEPAPAGIAARIAQTLYWYDGADEPEDGYTLTLGEWTMEPPPAPTWRKFFIDQGIPHNTAKEIEEIYAIHGIGPEAFDQPVP